MEFTIPAVGRCGFFRKGVGHEVGGAVPSWGFVGSKTAGAASLGDEWRQSARGGGEYERSTGTHGERGIWYVYIDAGHAAQNLLLQTTAMGLGTGLVGTFHDEDVSRVLENLSLASTSVGFAGRIPE